MVAHRNGDVYGCGSNKSGQLPCLAAGAQTDVPQQRSSGSGDGSVACVLEPTLLALPFVSCALRDESQVRQLRVGNRMWQSGWMQLQLR